MEHKKKYHGKLSLLFGLLFCLLLEFSCTTCFAGYNDPFSQAEIEQVNTFFNVNYSLENYNTALNGLKNIYPTLNKLNIFFIKNSTDDTLYIYPNNGTFDNNLEYIYIRGNAYSFYTKWIESIDDTTQSNSNYYYFQKSGNNVNVIGSNSAIRLNYYYDENHPVINGYILSCPMFLTTISTQSFYYYNPSTQTDGSYFCANYINLDSEPEPDEPSGDGGGGTVTPSGDTSGDNNVNIDYTPILDNINTNISNQGTAIINNQNENTDKIVNALSGETSKITNTLTDVPDVSDTKITSGDIERGFRF